MDAWVAEILKLHASAGVLFQVDVSPRSSANMRLHLETQPGDYPRFKTPSFFIVFDDAREGAFLDVVRAESLVLGSSLGEEGVDFQQGLEEELQWRVLSLLQKPGVDRLRDVGSCMSKTRSREESADPLLLWDALDVLVRFH